MAAYRPGTVGSFPDVQRELGRVAQAFAGPVPHILRDILHAPPEKVVAGMEILADGTDWNPGSGAGFYRRSADNTSWTYMEASSVALALAAHFADMVDAHDASAISNVAAGNISATDVQAAINELDTEKQPLDATLTALAGANWAANSLPIGSGADTVAQVTFAANTFPARASTGNLVAKTITDAALTVLDDTTTGAMLTTLGAQPVDSDLTAIAAIAPTNDDIIQRKAGAWTNRTAAQYIVDLGAVGTTFQPLDSDLTSWAGVTRAAGFDTFAATPSSANLRALLSDESGTGAAYFQGGDLGTPSAGVATNLSGTASSLAAGSAAKWTTARNLAGNSVDGSANVAFANKFIVQGTSDTGLSAAQFLGALSTGLMKVTTTTGVISVAADGTDYLSPAAIGVTVQAHDPDLDALAGISANGMYARTGSGTATTRTVTGTANQIAVTNGNGIAGDPTLSLPNTVIIPSVLEVPNTGLRVQDTDASHDLIIAPGSNITANRTLTLSTGDANRTLTLSGDATLYGTSAPITKTAATFTLAATESWIICNRAGTITATFPAASSFPGRSFTIKTITANTVVSASSDVVPRNSATAGTAILAAAAGNWATLVSDGTSWVVMAGS